MIVHVSGREAMEQIRWAQQRGLPVYAETCPQYITLTADDMKGLNMDMSGAKYVCSPPPRDTESQQAIWEGISGGVFQTFSSDHCPFRYDDPKGKLTPNSRTSFRWVPNGIPGVETRLPILFSEGVSKGRISSEIRGADRDQPCPDLRPLSAQGLDRGRLRRRYRAVGPEAQEDDPAADLHHGSDYTPWEGFEVTGWPVTTIARGRVVVRQWSDRRDQGRGRGAQPRQVKPGVNSHRSDAMER